MSESSELDAVLDTMVDGVIMIDTDGYIQRYNPACERIFGFQKEDVIGQDVSLLMPEPDRSRHGTYISNYQASGNPQIIGIGRQVKGRRKNGQIFPMYLSVGEMPDSEKNAFVGIIRDMSVETEQRAKFDILQQEHFHLSRVAAMDQMGSAIAHELNQPLTAIMNYLEAGTICLRQTPTPNTDKLENVLAQAALQTERAAKILSRLRTFIETGKVERAPENIETLIKTALDLIEPAYKAENFHIVLNICPNLPPVNVSDVQIQQVLVNLVRNAYEAMQNSQEKHLTINVDILNESHIKIGILDTGEGISQVHLDKLYEPFSSTKKSGLGVGLSICKSIILAHDGQLWAEQRKPSGSCFYFTLPVSTGR